MEEQKQATWFSQNRWIVPFIVGALAFVGLFLPLVQAHTVSNPVYNYETYAWDFVEGKRVGLGAGMLVGLDGAVVWPYWAIYGLILLGIVLLPLGKVFHKEETMASIATFLFMVAGVSMLLSAPFYGFFNATSTVRGVVDAEGFEPQYYSDNYYAYIKGYVAIADGRLGAGGVLSGALSILACLLSISVSLKGERIDIRSLSEMGMLSAAAIVLDVIFHFIPNIPGQVGSLSIALVPLFILALRHGPAKAFIASTLVYGLITCFTDGYGLWLYPLDYFVAFSGVAIMGFFSPFILGKDQKTYNIKGMVFLVLGCLLAGVIRYFGSLSSSIVNYGYTLVPALIVNLYALISAGACAVVLCAFYGPLLRINHLFPVKRTNAHAQED